MSTVIPRIQSKNHLLQKLLGYTIEYCNYVRNNKAALKIFKFWISNMCF